MILLSGLSLTVMGSLEGSFNSSTRKTQKEVASLRKTSATLPECSLPSGKLSEQPTKAQNSARFVSVR